MKLASVGSSTLHQLSQRQPLPLQHPQSLPAVAGGFVNATSTLTAPAASTPASSVSSCLSPSFPVTRINTRTRPLPHQTTFLLFLVFPYRFRTPMSNESQPRVFALKSSSNPEWELPLSEEKEAIENTSLALRKHASDARQAFNNERNVDWVIM